MVRSDLQFQEDMQALAAIDDGQSLLDRLQGCMVLVFTQYSGDFVAVDVWDVPPST